VNNIQSGNIVAVTGLKVYINQYLILYIFYEYIFINVSYIFFMVVFIFFRTLFVEICSPAVIMRWKML